MSAQTKLQGPPNTEPVSPSREEWERLTAAERALVVDGLPFVVEHDYMSEGDTHANVVRESREMLLNHFGGGGSGRSVYLGLSVMVHYPSEPGFAPDLFAVFDVPDLERDKYVVLHEGKGLDFALEVLWHGDRGKDLKRNVELFARLGIPEYFVYDRERLKLHGFRLSESGSYVPLLAQAGRFESRVLGLNLGLEGTRLRFYSGWAPVPLQREVQAALERAVSDAEARAEADAARARAEAARAETEAARANAAEARLSEIERQLAELRRPTKA